MRILHSKKLIYISKPRCGSTSVRRLIDGLMEEGDVACNGAKNAQGLHPHMTGPAILNYLENQGVDSSQYTVFTVTRHPLEMLWSYYNFFKPDENSSYNYSPNWLSNNLAAFDEWIMAGHCLLVGATEAYVPSWVSTKDLSPLCLETHVHGVSEDRLKVFKLEEITELLSWLGSVYGCSLRIKQVNRSKVAPSAIPVISSKCVQKVRDMFPTESEMYSL